MGVENGRTDVALDAILVLAVLALLAGVVAENDATLCRGDRRGMGVPT